MNNNILNLERVVKSNSSFAISLYQKLKYAEGNLFFSPYSISMALAMTFAGSRRNTEKQMAEILCFNLDQKELHKAFLDLETHMGSIQRRGNVQLQVANSLWPQIDFLFLAEYLDLLQKYYDVTVTGVDYRQAEFARSQINAWANEKTDEKINELIRPNTLDSLTTLVLANAIYFKGDWLSQFDKDQTEKAKFWITKTKNVFIQMMTQKGTFGYTELDNLQVLELPYQGGETSFIILLPKAIDGLSEIEETLSEQNLSQWIGNLNESTVRVFIPKLILESEFELSEILKSMGMTDAFDTQADFSGMVGKAGLFISFVIHKALIEVNEEGTEAVAATAVVTTRGLLSFPDEFRADHPFLFLIRENTTGSILFLGRMTIPGPVENIRLQKNAS